MSDLIEMENVDSKHKWIDDPLFGPIELKQYDIADTCKFDKTKFICNLPFTNVEIKKSGEVFVCCPEWNPFPIGNLLEDNLRTIWNGDKINALRDSMHDTSFRYCNHKACPSMLTDNPLNYIVPRTKFIDPKLNYPNRMSFSIDDTCNLECPSCRLVAIKRNSPEWDRKAHQVMNNVFDTVFEEPHDNEVIFTMDGSGEIFHSQVYRKVFEDPRLQDFDKWPNIQFCLCTNGTMMTPKIQNKYDHIMKRAESFRFSIDAGDRKTYEKVRKGGDWNMLWDNIEYCYEKYIMKMDTTWNSRWAFNLILQDDNFESLLNLVAIAETFIKPPEIYVTNMLHWSEDIMSNETFEKMAVWQESHPRHEAMKAALSHPKIKNYVNISAPF